MRSYDRRKGGLIMKNTAKAREMIMLIKSLAPAMTEEEISDVARIMLKVVERLEAGR